MNLPLLPLLLALAAPAAGSESLPTKEVLTLRVAKAIAEAAEAEAQRRTGTTTR
jgi:hypothetical protein